MNTGNNSTNWRFLDVLLDLGLNSSEAKVYELLLEKGPMRASNIAKYLGLSRVIIYKHLRALVEAGVITRNDPEQAVSLFIPEHPSELARLLEQKKKQITRAELELGHNLGAMASLYNLAGGKPNIQFYEGDEAVKRITSDFPTRDTEICQWMDLSVTIPHMGKEVIQYLKRRIRRRISKRMIVADNELSRSYASTGSQLTEFRIAPSVACIPTAIQVYDDTVAMLTFGEKGTVGVLLRDQTIATTMKNLFEAAWTSGNKPE